MAPGGIVCVVFLVDGCGEGCSAAVGGVGQVAARGCGGWEVFFVDADVEAGLLEFFFDVYLTLLDEGEEVAAHPGDLGEGEAVLGDVYGLASEMGRGGFALSGGGVTVGAEEALLELDGADGGVDLEGGVELGVVRAGHGCKELGGPGAGVAAVCGKAVVDLQAGACRDGDEDPLFAHVEEVVVVADAVEALAVGDLVLADEDLVGAFECVRDDEVAALVVERGQDDGSGGGVFDALQLRSFGGGPDYADCLDWLGG